MYVRTSLKRLFFIFLCLVAALSASAQTKSFKAQFRSFIDGEPILYAKLVTSFGKEYLTNSDGFVEFSIDRKDSLVVTHIAYDTLRVRISDLDLSKGDTLLFHLIPRVFEIPVIDVSLLGPRYTFNERFVALDLGPTDEERVKAQLELDELTGDLKALDAASSDGVVLGSPLTALYNRFSEEGKDRRMYAELLANQLKDSLNETKFNVTIVQQLTMLESEELTEDFMEFCSFHPDFIENSEPLIVYLEILRCKEEYILKQREGN